MKHVPSDRLLRNFRLTVDLEGTLHTVPTKPVSTKGRRTRLGKPKGEGTSKPCSVRCHVAVKRGFLFHRLQLIPLPLPSVSPYEEFVRFSSFSLRPPPSSLVYLPVTLLVGSVPSMYHQKVEDTSVQGLSKTFRCIGKQSDCEV